MTKFKNYSDGYRSNLLWLHYIIVMGDSDSRVLDSSIPALVPVVSSTQTGINTFDSEYNHAL